VDLFIQNCQVIIGAEGGLFMSLFLGGLLGSISHCTGMCGPIIMAQSAAQGAIQSPVQNTAQSAAFSVAHSVDRMGGRPQDAFPVRQTMTLQAAARGMLLPYHMGRLFTYSLLGTAAASLSQYLIGTPVQKAVASGMLFLAGVLFIHKSVPVLAPARGSAVSRKLSRPYGKLVAFLAGPFARRSTSGNLFFFGAMLGFLPCGLVFAAVMAAASTGDPLTAAFGMAAFGLGTVPSLLVIGASTEFLQRRWPERVNQVAKSVMAVNGLILCAVAVRLAV